MPAINRSDLVRGPAQVAFDSVTYQAAQDVALAFDIRTFAVQVGGVDVDQRVEDIGITARFAPSGKVEGLTSLFAALALPLGSGLLGDSDKAAVIKNAARQITLEAAGISKPPVIRASNKQTLFGEMEIRGLTKNDTVFGTAGSRFTDTTGGAPDGVLSSDIKTAPWTIGGANLGSDLEIEDGGVTLECIPTWSDFATDSNGVMQLFLTGCIWRATFIPVIGASAFLDAVDAAVHVARGSSLNAGGEDFVLTNGFITATLNAAAVRSAAISQAINNNFARQVVIEATRTSSSAALGTVVIPSS